MNVELKTPIFKCSDDESIFFSRLYALPAYNGISGERRKLIISLNKADEKETLNQLHEICDIWNTSFKVVSN